MSKKTNRILIIILAAILIAGSFALFKKYSTRLKTQKVQTEQQTEQKAVLKNIAEEETEETTDGHPPQTEEQLENPAPAEIPEKYLLKIPFYSQAPFANWDAFHEDMCEEASILNATYFLLGKKPSLEKYENELQEMQDFEKKEIGEWKSTTTAQIKKLVDAYFEGKIESRIIENPTIDEIQAEVASGRPVIVPLSGRDIGNPNYRQPGPIYHMLVVKGYDEKFFVTNDVGTRRGDSYVYKKEVIMNNIHDWDEADIHKGRKRVLVLYK